MTTIAGFTGKYSFLSNFYQADIEYEGRTYPTIEHALQAAKTLDAQARYVISIAEGPARAKMLGRMLSNRRPNWNDIRFDVMLELQRSKYRNPRLEQRLIDTGQVILMSVNDQGDQYWGTYNGWGRNQLGVAIMAVRAELRKARGMMNRPMKASELQGAEVMH